jgi:hypothetical protein
LTVGISFRALQVITRWALSPLKIDILSPPVKYARGRRASKPKGTMNPNLFAPLMGQTAQGCWLGYGNTLFLEFGLAQPLDDGRNHPQGEWGLWCERMVWRIEQGDRVHAGFEDDRDTVERAIKRIDGSTFISGDLLRPFGDSILIFSDNLVLRTFVTTTEEDSRWLFRDRDGKYFRLGPDRAYPEEQADLRSGQKSQ